MFPPQTSVRIWLTILMMLHLISRGLFVALLIHGWQLLGRLTDNFNAFGDFLSWFSQYLNRQCKPIKVPP
jgi:hypothetical protein